MSPSTVASAEQCSTTHTASDEPIEHIILAMGCKHHFIEVMTLLGAVVRFVVSALVILFIGYVVPGFSVVSFTSALLAALVITLIAWGIEAILGEGVSPRSRGVVSFLVAAVVIWSVQYVVPGVTVTVLGAILASLVIGLIDTVVPTTLR